LTLLFKVVYDFNVTYTIEPGALSHDSTSERWRRHFLQNREARMPLPWHDPYHLSTAERALIGKSVQQFHLGEWANGRGFRRRASSHRCFAADSGFQAALQLFIEEEQGHSRLLGRFLDHEGIPRLEQHWLDGSFRGLRKLAGLEACVTVLVTAEVLAVPFYTALRDATRSTLLRAICTQILRDEAHHLNYQALTLGRIQRQISGTARSIRVLLHGALFRGTALLLWQQHCRVFHAAGWSFRRFWRSAESGFLRLQRLITSSATATPRVN
jgi:hypothetical protein